MGGKSLLTIRDLQPAADSNQPVTDWLHPPTTAKGAQCAFTLNKSLCGGTPARCHSNRPSVSAELNYNTANSV